MRFIRQAVLGASLLALLSIFLTGCGRSVAKVDGEKISRREYYNRLEKLAIPVGGRNREAGQVVLQLLIEEGLREKLAKKEGVYPTKEQIQKRLDAMKKDGSRDNLKRQGYTDKEIEKLVTAKQVEMNLLTKGVKVTEDDKKAYYKKHLKDQFTTMAGAEMAVIITESKAKTDLVRDLLHNKHVDFNTVAMKHLTIPGNPDQTRQMRKENGRLGFMPEDYKLIDPRVRLPLALHTAMFKLQPGDISPEPIKDGNVWYTFKMMDRRKSATQKYNAVRGKIEDMVLMEKAGEMYNRWTNKRTLTPIERMEEYSKTAKVKVNMRRYKGLWTTMRTDLETKAETVREQAKSADKKRVPAQ